MNKIIHGNCLEKLKTIKENSVDSIVTDPPYELGFMGKSWDNSGIAYKIEMWRECFRVLKPGGHLLSFGGTRTYHRMACAIEDAGFEIRDMIEWVYGSGFPKSLNIGKAVDKLQGNEREVVGKKIRGDVQKAKETGSTFAVADANKNNKAIFGYGIETLTKGTSEYEGWGTALKPAHEPICMARKPLSEKTIAENCLKWRTGGINVDESRVEHNEECKMMKAQTDDDVMTGGGKYGQAGRRQDVLELKPNGRFPANLIHDNSEEVRECFPETGKSTGGRTIKRSGGTYVGGAGDNVKNWTNDDPGFGDSGNASRFFKSIIYTAKASKSERNKGCEGLKEKEVRTMNDFGDQSLHKCSDGVKRTKGTGISKSTNNHPTVKPIALMEYLIKMVTSKGGIVLDPFAGSGSTLVAAKQNGFQYIGIEVIEEYIPIIQCRVDAVKVARACLMFFDYQKNHHKRLKFTNNETPQSQNTKIKRRSSPPPQDNSTSNTKSKRKIKRRKK